MNQTTAKLMHRRVTESAHTLAFAIDQAHQVAEQLQESGWQHDVFDHLAQVLDDAKETLCSLHLAIRSETRWQHDNDPSSMTNKPRFRTPM
jgi:hypothetical protein